MSAHGHHHHHHPGETSHGRAFAIGVTLNVAFVIAEVIAGVWADSLALLADAGHNLSDVVSLLLAWGAAALAKRPPTPRLTYGYHKVTVLAALAGAILLLLAMGGITWEAVGRIMQPTDVHSTPIIVVAGIGVVINTVTALLFMRGRKHDLNIRSAFLHMAADAGISLGVVVGGIVVSVTQAMWIDPALSLAIVVVILIGTWGLLRDSATMAIDAVPRGIDPGEVAQFLQQREGVESVHDLHIWPISTTRTAATAHLVMPGFQGDDRFLAGLCAEMRQRFGIDHVTVQIERGDIDPACELSQSGGV